LLRGAARRCAQTATALDLPCEPDPALDDWDLGDWAGRTLDAVAAQDPGAVAAWLRDPDARPHGGETLAELLARSASWLDHQAADPATRVIAVSHPAVLRAVAVQALRAQPQAFWRLDAGPLATLTLTGRPGTWSVRLPTG
jgi:broad specificity phosphatase PhoE